MDLNQLLRNCESGVSRAVIGLPPFNTRRNNAPRELSILLGVSRNVIKVAHPHACFAAKLQKMGI